MFYQLVKVLISAVLLVAVSEVAKRSPFLGGVLASLPLVSLLAMIWLYLDTGSAEKVAELSLGIFWMVLPSLPLFLTLPVLLRKGGGLLCRSGAVDPGDGRAVPRDVLATPGMVCSVVKQSAHEPARSKYLARIMSQRTVIVAADLRNGFKRLVVGLRHKSYWTE